MHQLMDENQNGRFQTEAPVFYVFLPDELGRNRGADFGLRGRVSIVRDGELQPLKRQEGLAPDADPEDTDAQAVQQAPDTDVAWFPIGPNRQLQVLQLPEEQNNEHFHVTVRGNALNREECSSCKLDDTRGQNDMLAGRPSLYTPIQVPLYNEAEQRERELEGNDSGDPLEHYQWIRRPEYQFSQVQFEIEELIARQRQLDGSYSERNLLEGNQPVLNTTADKLEAFYDLVRPDGQRLPGLDGEREYVLGVGEDELVINASDNGERTFTNLEHLGDLQAEDQLSMRLYLNHDPENVLWEWAFATVRLVADMNRDGRIVMQSEDPEVKVDTINSPENPFRMWINDDDNAGEILGGKGSTQGATDVPGQEDNGAGADPSQPTPDYVSETVEGMRDLVDFFPVYVDAGEALQEYSYNSYEYRLAHDDGGLNFFEEPEMAPNNFIHKVQRPDALLRQPLVAGPMSGVEVKQITEEGTPLSESFANQLVDQARGRSRSGGMILVEGRTDSEAPLELVVVSREDGEEVARAALDMNVSPVESMYRHVNLQEKAEDRTEQLPEDPEQDAVRNTDLAEPENQPDDVTDNRYFFFVHGYNVSGIAARGWNAQIFKRMYRLGFNGRFVGFTWHGDTADDYHQAVYNAFQTASAMPDKVQQLRETVEDPGPITVAAHSLGNVVVSSAIAEQGLTVDNYIMLNAAAPLEAYDAARGAGDVREDPDNTEAMVDRMTASPWKDYPKATFASQWHALFGEEEARANLTWSGRFTEVLDVAHNFYSPGEEVLQNASGDEALADFLWEKFSGKMQFWDRGSEVLSGELAWVMQELAKGCADFLQSFVFEVCSAGWHKNKTAEERIGQYMETGEQARSALEAPGMLTEDSLREVGAFRPFEAFPEQPQDLYDSLYAPTQAQDSGSGGRANNVAELNSTQWDLLASSMPALSYAAGANSVESIGQVGGGNFNMEEIRGERPDWPQLRVDALSEEENPKRWLHSDIRNIALPYIAPIYDEILRISGDTR